MQHSALPYELKYFDIYKEALRYRKESDAYSTKAAKSLITEGAITPRFDAFVKASQEANTKAVQQLNKYGNEFLNMYIEPTIQEMEDSLNTYDGLAVQYAYPDPKKKLDRQLFKQIKSNIATLSIGIKSNSSLRDKNSEDSLTFDELHQLIKQMWSHHTELLKLSNRLSDMVACLEEWLSKRDNKS